MKPQLSINGRADKQIVIHSQCEILHSNENDPSVTTHSNMDEPYEPGAEWENPDTKEPTVCLALHKVQGQEKPAHGAESQLLLPTVIAAWGRCGQAACRTYRGLVSFCFLIWVLVRWMCSAYKNSLSCLVMMKFMCECCTSRKSFTYISLTHTWAWEGRKGFT